MRKSLTMVAAALVAASLPGLSAGQALNTRTSSAVVGPIVPCLDQSYQPTRCIALGAALIDSSGNLLGTSGNPLYVTGGGGSGGAVYGPSATGVAPSNPPVVLGGVDGSGYLRTLRTDSGGYLLPARGTPSTTVTAISASTATSIASAATTRIGETIITTAANSAPIYICYVATTTCSATVYDDIIPINTAAGAHLTPLFGVTSTVYAFTASATGVAFQSWGAQ